MKIIKIMIGGKEMQKKFSTRPVDELGRIVLPQELRKEYNIQPGTGLDIIPSKNGEIILRKAQPRCIFCQSTENLMTVLEKTICSSCKAIISEK